MRQIMFLFIATVLISFTACTDSAKEQAKENVSSLNQYVDSVDKIEPVYTEAQWVAIDNGYQERLIRVDSSEASLSEEERAKANDSKAKYAEIRVKYETKIKDEEAKKAVANDPKQSLRNSLFGAGRIGADMQFGFVTAQNILGVYENFVTTVSNNQNNYTREDWDEIKVLYEALDTRKNEIEKDLAGNDNINIAKQKVKFASIKSVKRPFSKGKENKEAKEQ